MIRVTLLWGDTDLPSFKNLDLCWIYLLYIVIQCFNFCYFDSYDILFYHFSRFNPLWSFSRINNVTLIKYKGQLVAIQFTECGRCWPVAGQQFPNLYIYIYVSPCGSCNINFHQWYRSFSEYVVLLSICSSFTWKQQLIISLTYKW